MYSDKAGYIIYIQLYIESFAIIRFTFCDDINKSRSQDLLYSIILLYVNIVDICRQSRMYYPSLNISLGNVKNFQQYNNKALNMSTGLLIRYETSITYVPCLTT